MKTTRFDSTATAAPTESNVSVAGAGDASFNGTYTYTSGTGNTRIWTLAGPKRIIYANGVWQLNDETNYPALVPYQSNGLPPDPWSDTWSELDAPAPAPTVTEIP